MQLRKDGALGLELGPRRAAPFKVDLEQLDHKHVLLLSHPVDVCDADGRPLARVGEGACSHDNINTKLNIYPTPASVSTTAVQSNTTLTDNTDNTDR